MYTTKCNPRSRRNHYRAVGMPFSPFFAPVKRTRRDSQVHTPAVNIAENEDAYQIQLAAPGFGKDNFKLVVDNDVLTITAKKETKEKEGTQYTRREFNLQSLKRSFQLPESVEQEAITANFEQGILTVTLNKKEAAKPVPARKIEIA